VKPGDVVRLNSGGPDMTVHSTWMDGAAENVQCTWFRGDEDAWQNYPAVLLTIVPDSKPQLLRQMVPMP
jgi:uncharacterized protein YodC (DUF2158 family)